MSRISLTSPILPAAISTPRCTATSRSTSGLPVAISLPLLSPDSAKYGCSRAGVSLGKQQVHQRGGLPPPGCCQAGHHNSMLQAPHKVCTCTSTQRPHQTCCRPPAPPAAAVARWAAGMGPRAGQGWEGAGERGHALSYCVLTIMSSRTECRTNCGQTQFPAPVKRLLTIISSRKAGSATSTRLMLVRTCGSFSCKPGHEQVVSNGQERPGSM